jgi:chromosomal replication initiation ATPase DnaA
MTCCLGAGTDSGQTGRLLLTGQTGTGKTWLACAVAHQAARKDQPSPLCPGFTETAVRELVKSLSGISEIRTFRCSAPQTPLGAKKTCSTGKNWRS